MNHFQKLLLERPIATIMFYLSLILFGLLSLRTLPIFLLPNIEYPKLTIITAYPNASPSEVENLITRPLTEILGTVKSLDRIDSKSVEGYSYITLRFKNSENINFSILEVRERIDLVKEVLPQDSEKPIITRFDPNKEPIYEIVFFSKSLSDPRNLRSFINENIKVYLDRIEGVSLVKLSGGWNKEVIIDIDPEKIASYYLSILDVKDSILKRNANYPAGQLPVGKKEVLVRAVGEYSSLQEIGETIISVSDKGAPIKLKEFSEIENTYKEQKGLARFNGEDCVIAYIYKEPGKNTVQISKNIETELIELSQKFDKSIKIETAYNESVFIEDSIQNLFSNLIIGSILSFISLLILIRNFYTPFILLIIVPTSISITFLFFNLFDITINMMSLGGLALGVGMLYDNSNVVLSGIERNLKNYTLKEAILIGVKEVNISIFTASLTTVLVFLPIVFLKSIIGLVFSEMAKSIVISLLLSLILSLTLVPVLCSIIYKYRKNSKIKFLKYIQNKERILFFRYRLLLKKLLHEPKSFIKFIFYILLFSLILFFFIKKEFIPKIDTGEFFIYLKLPTGTNLKITSETVKSIEEILKNREEVESYLSFTGTNEDDMFNIGSSLASDGAQIRVILKEAFKRKTFSFMEELREEFNNKYNFEINLKPGGDKIGALLTDNSGQIEIRILSDNTDELLNIGSKIQNDLIKIQGVTQVHGEMEEKAREIKLDYEHLKISKFGFFSDHLSNLVKTGLKGSLATQITLNGYQTDIKIKFQKKFLNSIEELQRLKIKTNQNEIVELGSLVKILNEENFKSIQRVGNSRANTITINSKQDELELVTDTIETYLKNLKLKDNVKVQLSGEKEYLLNSMNELLAAFVLAGILIYMLLSAQFESLKISLIMICSIPLIFIGILPSLFIFDKSINVSSFMGIILLVGIVVDNSSLFYEYLHFYIDSGQDLISSTKNAGSTILKPVLMNNTTTILGMLPVVLGLGRGGEFQSPLGLVVISGLLASVILTMFLIPSLFFLLLNKKQR